MLSQLLLFSETDRIAAYNFDFLHVAQFFIYLNGSIKPRNTTLSKASFEDMLSQKADKLTKELTTDDLLDGVIFLIYARKKVAFNCVEPSQLIVDDQQMTCDIGTLQFIDNPKTIILATEP